MKNPTARSNRLRRDSNDVAAERIASLFNNPDIVNALDVQRDRIISDLETVPMDGSEASQRKALELVRQLQTFIAFKRQLLQPILVQRMQNQKTKRPL